MYVFFQYGFLFFFKVKFLSRSALPIAEKANFCFRSITGDEGFDEVTTGDNIVSSAIVVVVGRTGEDTTVLSTVSKVSSLDVVIAAAVSY
jgi:hypothetical protein